MPDPKKEPDRDESPTPEPRKGGFGAFGDVYRARWATNHPNMRRWEYGKTPDTTPVAPPAAAPAEEAPHTRNGTKLHRPEE